jgi:hypothetical protein
MMRRASTPTTLNPQVAYAYPLTSPLPTPAPAPNLKSPAVCMSQGLSNYQENYKQDWINSWMIWVPGHVVTANLSAHLKVPWVAAVSFGYVCMLSATRGEFVVKEEQVKKASKALVRKVTKIIMPSEEEEEDDRQSRK